MGPPGGGRNDISARFMRHLQIISIDDFDENTMLRIFYAISEWHFNKGYESVFIRMSKVGLRSIHAAVVVVVYNNKWLNWRINYTPCLKTNVPLLFFE